MIWCGLKSTENLYELVNQFHENFRSEALSSRKIKCAFSKVMVNHLKPDFTIVIFIHYGWIDVV